MSPGRQIGPTGGVVGAGGGGPLGQHPEGSDGKFTGNENTPINEPIYGESRRSMIEKKQWDVFRTLPPGNNSYSKEAKEYLDLTVKLLKFAWVWLLWLLSQTWITLHIWTPKKEGLASTEKLCVTPMYNSLLIDQSHALNRRREPHSEVKTEDVVGILNPEETEKEISQQYETISIHKDSSNTNTGKVESSDQLIRIYATATMWHETEGEMMEMLKSIFRMDEDQSARRVAQKYLKIVDLDYYDFETHIFLDDGFEISDENEEENVVNQFVRVLVNIMDDAASHVHQTNVRIRPPKKYPTPYGGRLVWTLPGKTKIICHVKDKSKIRHKKRWSQVMYMYYILGFKLMNQPISVDRKEIIAENTYLLTLDGDTAFMPQSLALLIDLMKKNRNLGAACGRMHPIGTGMMVWYQMFEYAVMYWVQKTCEHMIGSVLCCPGSFSVLRGKALMNDGVMATYTTKSTHANDYVQYDQGEDRWLTTLLLKSGYHVEYSAAAVSDTHVPEDFNEFCKQRQRWIPSYFVNFLDLLRDYKKTIEVNDNISLAFIFYQLILMGAAIFVSGASFIMLVGVFVDVFRISNWLSLQINIFLILIFMVICFTCKTNIQLLLAKILSVGYALIMIAVIVSTILQLAKDGISSQFAFFFILSSGSIFIAACMHPQEFKCIIPVVLYIMAIPSMHLLLIIYCIINLNKVSWGTREITEKKNKKEMADGKTVQEDTKKVKKYEGPKEERDELINPYWIEDRNLKHGEINYLPEPEIQFFKDLIEKYLYPLDKSPAEQKMTEDKLMAYRNKFFFVFFMLNSLYVLIVFLWQLYKDEFHINCPLGIKENINSIGETQQILITKEYVQLEPIGLVYSFFFGLIIIVQFVAMLFYRCGEIFHMLSSTVRNCFSKKG